MTDRIEITPEALELFEQILDEGPEFVEELLGRIGAERPGLADQVRALLAQDETGPALFAPDLELPYLEIPSMLGRWRLGAQLGKGGMSTVFVGEAVEGEPSYAVAVKVLRESLQFESVERWRQEASALGALEHPHIGRLLDSGMTEQGVPWLAIERIDGEPITVAANQGAWTVRRRIEVVLSILDAVEYAHSRFVVHGDLKPSNILVDHRGEPKLLDFGIAQRAGGQTKAGIQAMTPAYASPEQLRGSSLGYSSDVYSLGVLLFELLTGCLPCKLHRTADLEARLRVMSQGPPSLDTAIHGDQAIIARERPMSVRRLRAVLRGDLNSIVAKALSFCPEARYRSVTAMGQDMRRYLDGSPVSAHPATRSYRIRKWARRQQSAIAMCGLLSIGLVVVAWQAVANHRQKVIAELQRQRSETTTELLIRALADVPPSGAAAPPVTAEQVLDAASSRVVALTSDRKIRSDLLHHLAKLNVGLGLHGKAETMIQAALDACQPCSNAERGPLLITMARIRLGAGDWDGAERVARQVNAAIRSEQVGPLLRASALATLAATVLTGSGNQPQRILEAEELAREAVEIGEAASLDPLEISRLQVTWAKTKLNLGDYGQSLELARLALEKQIQHGALPGEVAETRNEVGVLELSLGRYDAARSCFEELIAHFQHQLGSHPDTAGALTNLAAVYTAEERFGEAILFLREARKVYMNCLGSEHPLTIDSGASLGHALLWSDQAQEAESFFRETVLGLERMFGADSLYADYGHALLAECLMLNGDRDAAEAEIQRLNDEHVDLDGNWIQVTLASIKASVQGGATPGCLDVSIAHELEAASNRLVRLRGTQFKATRDACRRLELYRRRGIGEEERQALEN